MALCKEQAVRKATSQFEGLRHTVLVLAQLAGIPAKKFAEAYYNDNDNDNYGEGVLAAMIAVKSKKEKEARKAEKDSE